MRLRHGAIAALVACAAAAPASSSAAVSVRVTSLRIVDAQSRKPARPPYRRARAYAYVVRYRIAGEPMMRVSRRAVISFAGAAFARVRPPATFDEPGAYFATSRLAVGPSDPRGTYLLRYTISVRGRSGARAAVTRQLRVNLR